MSILGTDQDFQAKEQADLAISFLHYCANVEQGGDEGSGKRDLDVTEEEIRDSALSDILLYLEKAFLQIPCQIKKNRSKRSAPIILRGRSRKTSR